MSSSRAARALLLASLVFWGGACPKNDSACDDAGCPDGNDNVAVWDGLKLWGLSRGTSEYTIGAISGMSDGCMLLPQNYVGMGISVTYDEATYTLSAGDAQGTPPLARYGSGIIGASMGTLMRESEEVEQNADPPCGWHDRTVSRFMLVDHDRFTLAVTDTESMYAATCPAPGIPAGGTCTSTWTWTLARK
jgi:hypothetical protein